MTSSKFPKGRPLTWKTPGDLTRGKHPGIPRVPRVSPGDVFGIPGGHPGCPRVFSPGVSKKNPLVILVILDFIFYTRGTRVTPGETPGDPRVSPRVYPRVSKKQEKNPRVYPRVCDFEGQKHVFLQFFYTFFLLSIKVRM